MASKGNRGYTHQQLSTPLGRNNAEMGLTHTILLEGSASADANRRFQSGLILSGETVPVKSGSSLGYQYNTSTDRLAVYIGTTSTVKAKNNLGEELTIDASTFMNGTLVRIDDSPWKEFNGYYVITLTTISTGDIILNLERAGWVGEADIAANQPKANKDDADFDGDGDGGYLTVIPFSNAYCVDILGIDGLADTVTAVGGSATVAFNKFEANNIAGISIRDVANTHFSIGTKIYADFTDIQPGTGVICAVYCQAPPSLDFSPERRLVGAGGKGEYGSHRQR
jgi:hypothetical protein